MEARIVEILVDNGMELCEAEDAVKSWSSKDMEQYLLDVSTDE